VTVATVVARPPVKPLLCPVCRRHLGTTTAPVGSLVTVKCGSKECKRWRHVLVI
jgi:hypothetical protein